MNCNSDATNRNLCDCSAKLATAIAQMDNAYYQIIQLENSDVKMKAFHCMLHHLNRQILQLQLLRDDVLKSVSQLQGENQNEVSTENKDGQHEDHLNQLPNLGEMDVAIENEPSVQAKHNLVPNNAQSTNQKTESSWRKPMNLWPLIRDARKVVIPEEPLENEQTDEAKDKSTDNVKTKTKTKTKSSKSKHKVEKSSYKYGKVETNTTPAQKRKQTAANGKLIGLLKVRRAGVEAAADSTTSETNIGTVTKHKKDAKDDAANDAKEFNLKIVSWNVAGLRSLVSKNGGDYFEHENPDIICLQEIKCLETEVPEEAKLKGYHPYWCSTPGGHAGVAILSKQMPYNVEQNLDDEEMDQEGRIITAEYAKFYLICVYVPNAGRKLVNLDRRLRWNKLFEDHVTKLKGKKPVVICGDMNVAHEEIDLANPKTNKKNAGFSQEERDGMTDLLELGFVDTFRELYPDKAKAYSFWPSMGGARAKNVGWRLDYSIVSENLKSKVVDSFMRPQVLGSDHCPIVLLLDI